MQGIGKGATLSPLIFAAQQSPLLCKTLDNFQFKLLICATGVEEQEHVDKKG